MQRAHSSLGSFLSHRRVTWLPLVGVVQALSCVRLFLTPWTAAQPASLSIALSWSLLTLSPGVCLNSSLLSWFCLPTISSCVAPYSSCPQSFPASESFPTSQLFESGGQRTGASASVLPINIQGFPPSICGEVIGSDALILGVPFRHG